MGVIRGEEMVLNIGPQHPATHGVLRLQVRTDGEVVSQITPYMGYLHRCFEKHCENVTYEQVIPFTDRCDYLSSMSMNFGYVVAMERLMDIKVNWRILAQSGLTINNLNQLIIEKSPKDADLIIVGIGGNDVFNLTSPWDWLKHLDSCVKYFLKDGKTPIILFS